MTGTMLDVKIDRDDPTLLHDQVAAQIRRAIADGEAKPGERLPPARHLAAVMHVNTNTVLRAAPARQGPPQPPPRTGNPRQRPPRPRPPLRTAPRPAAPRPPQRLQAR